jgi:methionyl-tRNA formyltransferase
VSIEAVKQKIIQANPDFLLVCAFGEIISAEILALPKFGSINVHPSLLPKYRGASPLQEALRNGDAITGVTWIFMTPKMDSGPIIEKKTVSIEPSDNFETLSEKLSKLSASHTVDVLMRFTETGAKIPQDEGSTTYCTKIRKEEGFIDVTRESASEIMNKIRAYTPWPGCSILWNNKRLKIIQAVVSEQKISSGGVEVQEKRILALGTRKGTLLPTRVQLEGKREMEIGEFLRGQKIIPKKIS